MSDNPPPLSKADRIAIGGAVAPIVRRQAEAPRVVTVVGKDGKPVRKTTSAEVAKAVLARSDIEFSVQPGKRPAYVACKTCGSPIKVNPSGKVREFCRPRTHKCQCGKPIVGGAGCGYGKLCVRCNGAKTLGSIPREERSERSTRRKREWWSERTPEQRTAMALRMHAATPADVREENARRAGKAAMAKRSPQERAEMGRRTMGALTPEQRREMAERSKAARAALAPDVRSGAVRKQWAALTPEQRSERGQKIWATRRANKPVPPPELCGCGQPKRAGAKRCRPCWVTRGSGR